MVDVDVPPEVNENSLTPVEVDDRVKVVPVVTGVPSVVWNWTLIGPIVAVDEAGPETWFEVILSWTAWMGSVWLTEVRPVADAVTTGDPALLSPT